MMATGSSPILRSRLELACEPSATRYALGHARDVVGRWRLPRAVAEDALLVVDELVINAVRHAGAAAEAFEPGRGQPRVRACALVLWVVGEDLLIAVQDQSDQPPVLREVSLDAEDGRGLQLVAGLSDGRWGCTFLPGRTGKVIWARLRLTPRQPSLPTGGGDGHRNTAPHDEWGAPGRRN
jgi:two-component sensor histidine kinase